MPAGSDPSGRDLPSLPLRFRPIGVMFAAAGFGVMLLVTLVAVWLTLPQDARDSFTPLQRITVVIMLAAAVVVGHAMARCRVDADDDGLTVVNGYRTHRLEWGQVVEVSLRPGNPWAVLDLSDGTTCSAMGIQGSDGARARRQARQLRDLVEAHAGREPDTDG
jgi:hypothetical protein